MARLVGRETHPKLQDRSDRRRTVLIIEAPATPSARLRLLAGRAGFRVLTASSGRLLSSVAHRTDPDLILLTRDTGPPGPSEIARCIKEEPRTRDIPIISIVEGGRFTDEREYAYPTEAVIPEDAADEEIVKTMRVLTKRAPRLRYGGSRSTAPLEGDLDSDAFPELLQFLFVTGKTGKVSILVGRRQGMICVDAGRVVHAEFGELEGGTAFRQMCFSETGWFRFEPGVCAPRRTMQDDGIGLLLESARRKDVAARDRRGNPGASPTAHPAKPLFEETKAENQGVFRSLGLAILLSGLVIAAFSVLTWAAS